MIETLERIHTFSGCILLVSGCISSTFIEFLFSDTPQRVA